MKTRFSLSGVFILLAGVEALGCLVVLFANAAGSLTGTIEDVSTTQLLSALFLLAGFVGCTRLMERDWRDPRRLDETLAGVARRRGLFWGLLLFCGLLALGGLAVVFLFPNIFGDSRPLVENLRPALLWALLVILQVGLALAICGRAALRVAWRAAGGDLRQLNEALKPEAGEGRFLLALLGLLLLGALLRLVFIERSIRYDESRTFFYLILKPLATLFTQYDAPNNHVFYTFLAWLSYRIFGDALWALRLPALLAGILLIPAAYLAAKSYFADRRIALLTAALVAGSSILVEYSVNARGYTLLCLLTLLLFALALFLKTHPNLLGWGLFAILSALGAFTIPIMLYPLAMLYTWLLLSALAGETYEAYGSPWRYLLHLAGAGLLSAGLTLLAYLPILLNAGGGALFGNPYVSPKSWERFMQLFPSLFARAWVLWTRDLPLGITLLIVGAFLLGLVFHKRLTSRRIPFVLAAVVLPLMVLAQRVTPYGRIWMFLLPFYEMFAAAGVVGVVDWLGGRIGEGRHTGRPLRVGTGMFLLAALLVGLGMGLGVASSGLIFNSDETGALVQAPQIADYLKQHAGPDERIISAGVSSNILGYYFRQNGLDQRPQGDGKALVVVVNRDSDQTLESVLREAQIDPASVGAPQVIREFGGAVVVRVEVVSR